MGKDLEVGRQDETAKRQPVWVGHFSEHLVTLFTFQPDPGCQGLAKKTSKKCLLPSGTLCGLLGLDLACD